MSTRAVIYLRQPADGQDADRVLAEKRRLCHDVALGLNWNVTAEIVEAPVKVRGARQGFGRMLRMIRGGEVEAVVTVSTDELYRSPRDLEDVLDAIEAGTMLAVAQPGGIDLTTETGRQGARIGAGLARRSGEGQRRRNLQRAEEGTARWTRRPFGFDRQGDEVTIVPAEAEALQWAAGKLLAGDSLRGVAQALNCQGHRTTLGNDWTASSLRRALLNPRFSGVQVYRGQRIGAGNWPEILSPQTQARLSEILNAPSRKLQDSTEPRWLGSGIYRCGICNGRLWPMGRKGVYICRDGGGHLSRQAEDVDTYVASVAPTLLARAEHPVSGSPEEISAYQTLAILRTRQTDLAQLVVAGTMPADQARGPAGDLADRIARIEAKLAQPASRTFFGRVAGAQERWDALDLLSRRRLLADNLDIVIKPIGRGVRASVEDYVEIKLKGRSE